MMMDIDYVVSMQGRDRERKSSGRADVVVGVFVVTNDGGCKSEK